MNLSDCRELSVVSRCWRLLTVTWVVVLFLHHILRNFDFDRISLVVNIQNLGFDSFVLVQVVQAAHVLLNHLEWYQFQDCACDEGGGSDGNCFAPLLLVLYVLDFKNSTDNRVFVRPNLEHEPLDCRSLRK